MNPMAPISPSPFANALYDSVAAMCMRWPKAGTVHGPGPAARRRWRRLRIGHAWHLGISAARLRQPALHIAWCCGPGGAHVIQYRCLPHRRLATATHPGLVEAAGALAEARAFMEARIFRMHGNWLLKQRNRTPTGLLRLFMFWWAWEALAECPAGRAALAQLMQELAPDVALTRLADHDAGTVFTGFVQQFYQGFNGVDRFILGLDA